MKRNILIAVCITILLVLTVTACDKHGESDAPNSSADSMSEQSNDITAAFSAALTPVASYSPEASLSSIGSCSEQNISSEFPAESKSVRSNSNASTTNSSKPASSPTKIKPLTSTPTSAAPPQQPSQPSQPAPSSVPEAPQSSVPAPPVYGSVADYIDKNRAMIEEVKASMQQEDMSTDIYASENSMVFSFRLTIDIGDTSELEAYFEQYFSQLEPAFISILDEMRLEIPSAESIILEYLDINGNTIASKEFK